MKHYHPFGFEFKSFFLQMSHAFENGPPTLLLHAQKSKSKENVIIVHLLLKIQGVQATCTLHVLGHPVLEYHRDCSQLQA